LTDLSGARESKSADDDPTLVEIDAGVATSDEISAADNFFAPEFGLGHQSI
jgi:hypothetical protein